MDHLLQLKNIHKAYGQKVLFENETLSINLGEHIGLIGPNGAGKTTLIKAIIGDIELDEGELIKSSYLRLGYLPQHDLWSDDETIESFLTSQCTLPIWELMKIGKGLGLRDSDFSKPIKSFSGGFRMRVKLLAMIGKEPNLMLLDEPTNYLDLETILVLENFLKDFNGAFVLISHDREFLRKTAKKTVEVEFGKITKVNDGLDKFLDFKKNRIEELTKQKEKVEEEKKEIIAFANRFRAQATKAKQVQSRLKRLDKLKEIELLSTYAPPQINLPEPERVGKEVIKVTKADFGYGDTKVLSNVNLLIGRGHHVGIVGFNGAGKSTLLKGLDTSLKALSGEVKHGLNVRIGFYAQHVIENLNLKQNVMEAIEDASHLDVTTQDVKNLAGALMFSGEDIKKPLSVLSGGELARVALARVLVSKASCLILDEPTNHLDFQTVQALATSIKAYPGTVIVVSHDREFIQSISSKIIEIRNGEAVPFHGTYEEYVWSLKNGVLKEYFSDEKKMDKSHGAASSGKEKPKMNQKDLRKKKQRLEKEIQRVEAKLEKLQTLIEEKSNALSTATANDLQTITEEITQLTVKLSEQESKWERKMSEVEELS